jgi:hypothetical protein
MSPAACGLGTRLTEFPGATANDFRSSIVIRIGIMHGRGKALLIHCPWPAGEWTIPPTAAYAGHKECASHDHDASVHVGRFQKMRERTKFWSVAVPFGIRIPGACELTAGRTTISFPKSGYYTDAIQMPPTQFSWCYHSESTSQQGDLKPAHTFTTRLNRPQKICGLESAIATPGEGTSGDLPTWLPKSWRKLPACDFRRRRNVKQDAYPTI